MLIIKDYSERIERQVAHDVGTSFFTVQPSGMGRPADDFLLTSKLQLSVRNTLAGGIGVKYEDC